MRTADRPPAPNEKIGSMKACAVACDPSIDAAAAANHGAIVINEANVFPAASASAHLLWRRTTQSNLYRVRLPDQ
jgi:hypothetical protein